MCAPVLKRRTAFALAMVLFCAVSSSADRPIPSDARAFVDRNCAACHRSANAPAGLDLTSLPFNLADAETYSRWVRVYDAVRNGQMPPGANNKLARVDRERFLREIGEPMIAEEQKRAAVEGRSVLRRLNRYEYENTVRDLLGAPWLQLRDSLPEDGIVQRFNKSGQALDISHVQMARYMETAEQALRQVLAAAKQNEFTQRLYAREQKKFIGRMRYTSFNHHSERASIPILGFEAQPDVLNEKAPMTVGASDPRTRELEGFATPAGNYVGNEHHFDGFAAPVGGRYHLRFNVFSLWIHTQFVPQYGNGNKVVWWRPNREKTEKGRTTEPVTIYALSRGGEKRRLGAFDVGPEPAIHELDADLLPGEMILPDASRLFRSRPGFLGSPEATAEGMPGVAYRWMEVSGPSSSDGARSVVARMFGGGSGQAQPEALLRQFMTAAYRRPPTQAEVQRYVHIVTNRLSGTGKDADFTEAMLAGYTAVLCSPGFLYLDESPGQLTSRAVANRLSYFLWNGPPDEELRKLSGNGTLRQPQVLRAQTKRLLNDPRSRDFVNAFLDYWIDLRKIAETTPDQTLYPDYYLDDLLVESALSETQLFFQHLLKKNLPVANIISSDFAMLNSRLARHYGLPPVDGVDVRYTPLPPDSMRGGLLTQASVLKITANGTTTSPVLRGVWIMERILGDPSPPPPPGTPAVEPDTRGATTVRQQLDKHRANASCATCHRKIDPPGFALENFDVAGAWRDHYRSTEQGEPVMGIGKNGHTFTFRASQPVDAAGQMVTGETFTDVRGLKQLLLRDERQLARNMVRQFIAYGTGAPVGFADRAEIERILDAAKSDHYGMRTLIEEVVQSKLFLNK